jgi:hypothetical protein
MKEAEHIITFLIRFHKMAYLHSETFQLKVDKDNTVEDVLEPSETTGGIIAGIYNDVGETVDKLAEYYKQTGNKKLLARLKKYFKNVEY